MAGSCECGKEFSVSHNLRGDGDFLTSRGNITFSNRTLLRGVNSIIVLRGYFRNYLHFVETSGTLSC